MARTRLAAVLVALSLGAQLAVAYAVAPLLFARLDGVTAGELAGELLHWVEWATCLLLMLAAFLELESGVRRGFALAVFLLQLVLLIYVEPQMHALKLAPDWPEGPSRQAFMSWHAVAQTLYLAGVLLQAGWLISWLRGMPGPDKRTL